MARERNPLFDIMKAIAIFMVVYSHVVFCRPGFDLHTMPSYAINFIWVVNMPIFFIISGYFSRRLHESGEVRRLANRLVKYFWPLATFGVFFAIVESLCCGKYTWTHIPLWAVKKFLFCGWFFYALAGCELITFFSFKASRKPVMRMLICICGFAVCLLGSGRVWHAKQIVAMVPFYWFGLCLLQLVLENKKVMDILACLGVVTLLCTTFCYGSVATNGLSFYWNYFDVINPTMHDFLSMLLRYFVGILGSLSILCCVRIISCWLNSLVMFGKESLGIYFLQGYVITYGSNKWLGLGASWWYIFSSAVIVLFLSWMIVKLLKANAGISGLVWGVHIFKV